ncbi:MAG: THUMP domain-containing protein [Gemmatimonadales bacterium]
MVQFLVGISPDITIKSTRTRQRFQARLVRNMRDALQSAGYASQIDDRWGRLFVDVPEVAARDRMAAVFGVHSLLEIEARAPAELSEIVRVGDTVFGERVHGRAFAVRARRDGNSYPFRSRDIEVQLGAALDRYGHVNLDQPDVTVYVEVRDGEAFLFANRTPGPGGLPLGVEGRAVALLSGGYDSPVAAWMMLRRGIALDYVFCNLAGEAYERSVVAVAKVLADTWSFGDSPRLHIVDYEAPLDELRRAVDERYWQLILKRLMYRTAGAIARVTKGHAIVTGESVGQVSSQTLLNLRAIEDAWPLPLFRPLLGLDKNEIIARARRVGTAILSSQIREFCQLGRARPITNATPGAARAQEARMDLTVLDRAVEDRKVLDLRGLDARDLVAPYLFTTDVVDGAMVLDCRPVEQYREWHYPGAERRDAPELAAHFRRLDKTRTYVLYCSFGVQSAHVAELMQQAGYEAYSFAGGVPHLRRYVERHRVESSASAS